MFRQEFKAAEIQANHENEVMYVTFRGERTFIEPNLQELSQTDIEERLRQLVNEAAAKVYINIYYYII